ncbi:MAG: GNAT family N-acetyltransferase [Bacteroidota bacterium]|nr:GNAT family N-acetyltransferase [Bacteroidota bacterium]MDX5431824.1 GNAT family N-acetyltransferase [Bacteroidota bacterium]MDX5470537.1 GNAT family N-acetyltransferase [Bacteroidota bacterium]
MSIHVEKIATQEVLELAWEIRKKVFVEEQEVDQSLEWEHEEVSTHFLALMDGKPVGTARWRDTGKGIKLERFAVLKEFRNQKVGEALLKAVLNDAPKEQRIYLHAQLQAEPFYARNGFKPIGEVFYEAGIGHHLMEYANS